MTSTRLPTIYTCDSCGATPLFFNEVARVKLETSRPPLFEENQTRTTNTSSAMFDICRQCLKTPRVPNPDPKNEKVVEIDYVQLHHGKLGKRLLKWMLNLDTFTNEKKEESCVYGLGLHIDGCDACDPKL